MLYTCVTEIICVDSHECNLYNKLRYDQEHILWVESQTCQNKSRGKSRRAFDIMGFIDGIFKNHGVCLGLKLKVPLDGLGNTLSKIVDVTTV